MPDFHQNAAIATLHDLGQRSPEELESELLEWSVDRPMALVLPSLASEIDGPALPRILAEIAEIPYLDEIIIGLDGADPRQFARAREFFGRLPQRHRILWNDGARLRTVRDELSARDLAPARPGKGRNVWWCLGYFLASGRATSVALHDCDILTYRRDLVARLFYPIVHPTFGYAFCKGFYYRAADGQMRGRVARLLVTPLVRALRRTVGQVEYLDYIDSFRYPLAGEFSMRADVVHSIRIPSDWGLEIGLLSEVWRHYTSKRICQADIAGAYDHKHQEVSPKDPEAGLHKMSIDIAKAMYRKLAVQGVVLGSETFRTVKASYYRSALDLVDHYHNDAVMNGLRLDRHEEEKIVEVFAQAIVEAGEQYLRNPHETPFLPSWSRVQSAMPSVLEHLHDAVEADNT